MYLWYILLVNNLLATSITELDKSFRGSGFHAQNVEPAENSSLLSKHSNEWVVRSESAKQRAVMSNNSRLSQLRIQQQTCIHKINGLQERISRTEKQIDTLNIKKRNLRIQLLTTTDKRCADLIDGLKEMMVDTQVSITAKEEAVKCFNVDILSENIKIEAYENKAKKIEQMINDDAVSDDQFSEFSRKRTKTAPAHNGRVRSTLSNVEIQFNNKDIDEQDNESD